MRIRDRYLRVHDRARSHPRPKGPVPREGWLVAELAALAGVAPRTVLYYVQRGLLPGPAFRGTATRYQRNHLLRLVAIGRMKREEGLGLAAIKARLGAMPAEELEGYATARLVPGALAAALGVVVEAQGAEAAEVPALGLGAGAPAARLVSEAWERIALLPGLDLIVKGDASPLVRRLVQEIHDHCVGSSPEDRVLPRAP